MISYKEALETLKFEVDKECHCGYISKEIHIAMKALEKQIPEKPFAKYLQKKDWMFCSCGKYLCNIDQEIKPNFCQWCGQALDWSKNN